MAESSGFFESEWDETLFNQETGTYGDWDLKYLAKQFADFFKLFVKNGIFSEPSDQLKISPGYGMEVSINSGWAFINGLWYNLDAPKTIPVPANTSSSNRTDAVVCRMDLSNRVITTVYARDFSTPTRSGAIYDLVLAQISVPPNITQIQEAYITDTRGDDNLCGYVTNLLERQTDASLQAQIGTLSQLQTIAKNSLVAAINELKSGLDSVNTQLQTMRKIEVVAQEPTTITGTNIVFVYEE